MFRPITAPLESAQPSAGVDAFAHTFVVGLRRTAVSSVVVAALLGVTLFEFVLPLLPWFGSRPEELARIFLFIVQHLGDVLAGVLVVGQAGLPITWELWRRARSDSGAAPLPPGAIRDTIVLPRVWALAGLYFVTLMLFKVTAVTVAAYVNYALAGPFLGAEIGDVIEMNGAAILGGYALNAVVAVLIGVVCCAPALGAAPTDAAEPPLGAVFRRTLIMIVASKLGFFLL